MKDGLYGRVLRAISSFLSFFFLSAVTVTCSIMLFVEILAQSTDIELTSESVAPAAKWTLLAIILLSAVFTLVEAIKKKLTVTDPVKEITEVTERIMGGDFSARIPELRSTFATEELSDIAAHINRMAEELSGTEMLRADFISSVSHEIRTPLSVIGNYAKLLESDAITEDERREYLRIIGDTSKKLAALVGNILKLNKLENQEIKPNPISYDLSRQVIDCLLGFESAWEAKGINIETDIDDGAIASSDPEMMSIVWNNLISNAIKFTDGGGTVKVSLKEENEAIRVEISDTGCGISGDVGKHIFDKFYQGETSRATEGNGLGLAIVRRIIDITSSEIEVESRLGVGTTFRVRVKNGKIQKDS